MAGHFSTPRSCICSLLILALLAAAGVAHAAPPPVPAVPDTSALDQLASAAMGPRVAMLYPKGDSTTTVNVTFIHNATGTVNCSLYVDGRSLRSYRQVTANQWRIDTSFTQFQEDTYVFAVNCTNGTWRDGVEREVVVDNSTAGLTGLDVSPYRGYPGQRITIEGQSVPRTTVQITVTSPALSMAKFNTTSDIDGDFTAAYTLPGDARTGSYRVIAYPVTDTSATLGDTFLVVERNPAIAIVGNKTNVTQGTAISFFGQEFLASGKVEVSIIGGGTTLRNTSLANSRGEFSYNHPGTLAAGSYVFSAHSTNDSAIAATLNFAVVTGTALPPPPAARNTTTPTITPNNPRAEIPSEDDEETVPSPPINNPPVEESPSLITPPYEPTPVDPPAEPGGSWWMWVLVPMMLVVAIGGVGAYLVSNGTLDVSSMDAFKSSLSAMLSGSGGHVPNDDVFARLQTGQAGQPGFPAAGRMDPGEMQAIRGFIQGERAKGFDDLTIRSALVAKGWNKHEVDGVFDKIYRGQ